MVKLVTSVRCAGDENFRHLQELLGIHFSNYTDDILIELRRLLNTVPTYVPNWNSPSIGNDTYRLYGKKTPAIEATRNYVNSIRNSIPSSQIREKKAVDVEK